MCIDRGTFECNHGGSCSCSNCVDDGDMMQIAIGTRVMAAMVWWGGSVSNCPGGVMEDIAREKWWCWSKSDCHKWVEALLNFLSRDVGKKVLLQFFFLISNEIID